jgi:homogentisate 1,2-dioxygenase
MPYYYKLGEIPPKRHTQFRKPDGTLYSEQLFSTEGFSNDYSLLYHINPPTQITKTEKPVNVAPQIAEEKMLQHRSFEGFAVKPAADYLESRVPILVNNDVHVVLAAPQQSTADYFYKNADADELLFVHEGSGVLKTVYGSLPFGYGDYLVVPRGTIYQIHFNDNNNRLFIVESFSPIRFPNDIKASTASCWSMRRLPSATCGRRYTWKRIPNGRFPGAYQKTRCVVQHSLCRPSV